MEFKFNQKSVGKIKVNLNHLCSTYVQWEIENYCTSVTQTVNTPIESPHFYFANAMWYLVIRPNSDKNEGWFFVSIILIKGPKKITVDCTLGILSHRCEQYSESFTNESFSEKKGWGFKIIKSSELHEKKEELVPGSTLTVFCRASMSSQKKEGISTLSEDLKNLFTSERSYDATIKVKDRSFNVHKVILGSRSPVLYAMFDHDMKENNSGTVNIDDCEPEIFHDFLLFLYSEKTEDLSPKNAASLYYLADKYLLGSLKEICLDFMLVNLNTDNIFEVLILADRYHEEQLMETASDFFKNNLKDIMGSDKWINFIVENSVFATELLKKAIP